MYEHTLSTGEWRRIETSTDGPIGRSSLVLATHGNSLLLFGGYSGVAVLNYFWEYK